MAIILIETATSVCSVALSESGRVIFEKASFDGPSHASVLGVFVEAAVQEAKAYKIRLDAVAISGGPGSYTGLRIGVSMAKGLCCGFGIPLLSIPTLKIMAFKAISNFASAEGLLEEVHFCPMIDARRMEVYAALYDSSLRPIQAARPEIITEESYAEMLDKRRIYFVGNGASKCKEVIRSPQAVFLEDIHPMAADMAMLSERALKEGAFESVAYFEPFYLKDFIATTPRNTVFNL